MAKECRKFGIAMVLASQEARDFPPSVFSAVANYLVLRVIDQDARALARNIAPGAASKTIADRMKQLPKYEAILFKDGNAKQVRLATSSTPAGISAATIQASPQGIAFENATLPALATCRVVGRSS